MADAAASHEAGTPPTAGGFVLDVAALAAIGSLSLRARIVAEGALAGLHRSLHRGSSVEFAEHKEYAPGDEIRHIDWKAYGKLDRYYVKQFEDETNLRGYLLLDASRSMAYRGGALSKLDYAKTLLGALGYALARQGDAVGVATFSDTAQLLVPPRAHPGHLSDVLAALGDAASSGPSRLEGALDALAELAGRRAFVAIASDLLDAGDVGPALARLAARKADVLLLHVLDRDEIELPFENTTVFASMEDDRRVHADAPAIRDAYKEEVRAFLRAAERDAASARAEYRAVVTDEPPALVLREVLARRERLVRRLR